MSPWLDDSHDVRNVAVDLDDFMFLLQIVASHFLSRNADQITVGYEATLDHLVSVSQ